MGIDTPESYRDAQRMKAAEERARKHERQRIRQELLDAIGGKRNEWSLARPLGEEITKGEREIGADAAFHAVLMALSKICPEEK